MDESSTLRDDITQLLLLIPVENAKLSQSPFKTQIEKILDGKYLDVLKNYENIITNKETSLEVQQAEGELIERLYNYLSRVQENFIAEYGAEMGNIHLHLVAVALFQLFIQSNFTGPVVEATLFVDFNEDLIQNDLIDILSSVGQQAYELITSPLLFIMVALIMEIQMQVPKEVSIYRNKDLSISDAVQFYQDKEISNPIEASYRWWMTRSLQVHSSLLDEPASILGSVSSVLLNSQVANMLVPSGQVNKFLQKAVQTSFFIESARLNIHAKTEHLAIPLLERAKETSGFQFILTGAKAKRTKFQSFYTSALVILAKSANDPLFETNEEAPESFELNSDILLERPEFSSVEDIEENDIKRIKLDFSGGNPENNSTLLPIAIRKNDIPKDLSDLDTNNQPNLSDLDNIQLILRLTTLRQTSPSGNELVNEQLLALVSRILFTNNVNWSVFSRSLWERSIIETTKAKTIERGILQMTSLVEEMGIKIQTRAIPESVENKSVVAARLRYIHQLPLLPQWQMDIKLAEKYMSIGVLRSAVDIYNRLNLVTEAALCYAAVGEEKKADKMLSERIESHPKDARAISILGDLRQDPALWEKSWNIGKYYKAQASLSRYFYKKNKVDLAIKHMNLALKASPINYENWYFYGCCGLESQQYELAAEAFTRCVSIDDNSSHAWSNLASALLNTNKIRPAFKALQTSIRVSGDNKSWKIYENYLIVAAKLGEWNDVLIAAKELIHLKRDDHGEGSIDIPVVEKLAEILVGTEYPQQEDETMTYYQRSCTDFICNKLPSVIDTSARCWRIVAKVEMWRKKPWAALECYEKAFRAITHLPEIDTDEKIWNEAVEACSDLVSAYENLGELPGKHGAEDVVCKDWKYKSLSTVRSLMSKGKSMWEGSEGWEKLIEMRDDLRSSR